MNRHASEGRQWHHTRDDVAQRVVSALEKLITDVPADMLFRFLHELHIQYTLSCDGKGKHHCRVFQNWRDEDGSITKVLEYCSSGKSAGAALRNAISRLLVRESDDYHQFVDAAWPEAGGTPAKRSCD